MLLLLLLFLFYFCFDPPPSLWEGRGGLKNKALRVFYGRALFLLVIPCYIRKAKLFHICIQHVIIMLEVICLRINVVFIFFFFSFPPSPVERVGVRSKKQRAPPFGRALVIFLQLTGTLPQLNTHHTANAACVSNCMKCFVSHLIFLIEQGKGKNDFEMSKYIFHYCSIH